MSELEDLQKKIKKLTKPCYHCRGQYTYANFIIRAQMSTTYNYDNSLGGGGVIVNNLTDRDLTVFIGCPECSATGGRVPIKVWEDQVLKSNENLKATLIIEQERARDDLR